MSHELKEILDSADHIKPASWRGNVKLKDVSLQTSWNCGWRIIKQECEGLKHVLNELDSSEGISILSLFGMLLLEVPLADNDIDESLEAPMATSPNDDITDSRTHEMDMHIDVEDKLGGVELAPNTKQVLIKEYLTLKYSSMVSKSPRPMPSRILTSISNMPAQQIS